MAIFRKLVLLLLICTPLFADNPPLRVQEVDGSPKGVANVLKYPNGALTKSGTTWTIGNVPGGSDTQVQINDAGVLSGDADMSYNKTTNVLTVGNATIGASGERVSGTNSFVDFNDGTPGSLTYCATGLTYNECIAFDLNTTSNRLTLSSTSGVNSIKWANSLVTDKVVLGGADVTTAFDVSSSIVSFYKMEENAASLTVADSSGGNTGTAARNTSLITTTGKLANGFTFNGTSDFIDLGSGTNLKRTGDITVELWIKTGTANKRIAGNRSSTGANEGWDLLVNSSGKAQIIVDTGTSVQNVASTTTITDSVWRHIVGVRSGSNLLIYVNGTSEGSPTGTISGDMGTNAGNTYIGRTPLNASFFNGQMDNLRIFSSALSSSTITALYNEGNGTEALSYGGETTSTQVIATATPVISNHSLDSLQDLIIQGQLEVQKDTFVDGTFSAMDKVSIGGGSVVGAWSVSSATVSFYKMEQTTGTSVTDEQAANAGTASRDLSNFTTTGKLSDGFNFTAASGDNINLGSGASLKFTGDFTAEAWFNTSTDGTRVMGNRSASGGNEGWEFVLASGKIRLQVDTGASINNIISSTTVTNGAWHHVVGIREGSTLKLYVDNVSEGTPSGTVTGDHGTSSGDMYLGRTPLDASYYNGKLDNVRFFNRALTAGEISQLYNSGTGTISLSGSGSSVEVHAIATTAGASTEYGLNSLNDLFIEDDLEAQGDVYIDDKAVYGEQAITVASTGDANPATATLTPTASYINYTCSDSDSCDITVSETGAVNGQILEIVNSSANSVDFSDSSGVTELNGAVALGQWDTLSLKYVTDRWVKIGGSDN